MATFTLHYATVFRLQRRLFLLLTPPDSVKLGFCYRRSRCRESTPVCFLAFTFTTRFYFSSHIIERYEELKIPMQTPRYSRIAALFLALDRLLLSFICLIALRNVYVCKCEIWEAYGYICMSNVQWSPSFTSALPSSTRIREYKNDTTFVSYSRKHQEIYRGLWNIIVSIATETCLLANFQADVN